jgi:hypothetical protein
VAKVPEKVLTVAIAVRARVPVPMPVPDLKPVRRRVLKRVLVREIAMGMVPVRKPVNSITGDLATARAMMAKALPTEPATVLAK